MKTRRQAVIWLLFFAGLSTGCGLNSAVLQKGGNGKKGVLLNYSCGAHPCDPIDPSKPTIVITHGWNPLPKRIRTTFACSSAQAIKCRCGDSYNLLSWDWNAVKVSPFNDEPVRVGRCQGKMLALALRCRGVNPRCTQIIGHSLGTIAAAQAAACLSDLGPTAQLTLLDPPTSFHEEIFCCLGAPRHACIVENYWSPGISGYGGEVNYRGVRNYELPPGDAPVRGILDLSVSNHVYALLWYYHTICDRSNPCGFQKSRFRCCCGQCNACCNSEVAENDSEVDFSAIEKSYAEVSEAATSAGSLKR